MLLKPIAERLRIIPADRALPAEAIERIAATYMCSRARACVALWLADDRIGVLGQNEPGEATQFDFVSRNAEGRWVQGDLRRNTPQPQMIDDLSKATITVETVPQRRIQIDGVPQTATFD